jgi:hypothetical protein
MAGVAIVAVALAGLLSTTDIWAETLFTLMVTALALALVGAAGREDRAFRLGFAVLGSVYLVLALTPINPRNPGVPQLITTRLIDLTFRYLNTFPDDEVYVHGDLALKDNRNLQVERLVTAGETRFFVARNGQTEFRRIGHIILSFVLAILGGLTCRRLFGERRSE